MYRIFETGNELIDDGGLRSIGGWEVIERVQYFHGLLGNCEQAKGAKQEQESDLCRCMKHR